MNILQQKKDCVLEVLNHYQNELILQINRLNNISNEEDYDAFFSELCVSMAKKLNEVLPELHLCQNKNRPNETQFCDVN